MTTMKAGKARARISIVALAVIAVIPGCSTSGNGAPAGSPTPPVAVTSPIATSVEARSGALPSPIQCDPKLGGCWRPSIGMDWQWQLSCDTHGTCANLAVKVPFYDIDWEDNPATTVAAIHAAGGHAYCYVDVGTWENWRSDAGRFPASVLGKRNGWPGERWLDVRRLDVLGPLMTHRMDVCKTKGFDGVQLDNVDGWQTKTGFPLTQGDYQAYTAWMANQAHARGMSAAWENAIENATALQPYMDALILEQCYQYQECDGSRAMIDAGKWVGGVEYKKAWSDLRFCSTYGRFRVVGAFKKLSLNSFRIPCP
jgi:hypothetical protein